MKEPGQIAYEAFVKSLAGYTLLASETEWNHLGPRSRAAWAAVEAACVPAMPDDDAFSRGVYAVADALCASEYVNAPDASFVLALAHRAFADGLDAMKENILKGAD